MTDRVQVVDKDFFDRAKIIKREMVSLLHGKYDHDKDISYEIVIVALAMTAKSLIEARREACGADDTDKLIRLCLKLIGPIMPKLEPTSKEAIN